MRDATPLGHYIDLTASDGGIVRSYVVQPATPARAVVVVLQHMDQRMPGWQGGSGRPKVMAEARPGVNPHVRQMAEAFAAQGYLAIAPSTFSRGHSGTDYGYRFEQGRWGQRLLRPLEPLPSDKVMLDVEAGIAHGRKLAPYARIGVVGYCWGGLLAWRAACELGYVSAAVCHYGGGMEAPEDRERQPLCPTLVHFPTDSRWMSPQGIEGFRAAHPPGSPAPAGPRFWCTRAATASCSTTTPPTTRPSPARCRLARWPSSSASSPTRKTSTDSRPRAPRAGREWPAQTGSFEATGAAAGSSRSAKARA